MRRRYGYGSYRGQGGFRTVLKVLVALLAVAAVVMVGGYLFLQQYAVVTDEGIHYDIPFLQKKDPAPSQSLVVETPPVLVTPTPAPEPEPEPEVRYLRMAHYEEQVLLQGALAQEEWAGIDAALFTMKGADGRLGYVSALQSAKDMGTSASNLELNAGIAGVNSSNGGTVRSGAYLACFRDDIVPYRRNSFALRSGAGNWRDAKNTRWMSPASREAVAYVVDVCAELAALGFRNLVLDYAAFPQDDGRLGYIQKNERYDSAGFEATVTDFYRQLRERIDLGSGWPVEGALRPQICIVTDKLTLDEGYNPATGQRLEALVQYADRIFVDVQGEDLTGYYDKLRELGMERPEENLVLLATEAVADDAPYSWAILPS